MPDRKTISERFGISGASGDNRLVGTVEMSLPTPKMIHGIEVKKAPICQYMQTLKKGAKLLPMVLDKLFPGMSTASIVAGIVTLESDTFAQLLVELMIEVPESLLEVLAELFGCEFDALYRNPDIGPNELMDIWDEWNKINNVTGFFRNASKQFLLLNWKRSPTH